jgi:hypothetical protein
MVLAALGERDAAVWLFGSCARGEGATAQRHRHRDPPATQNRRLRLGLHWTKLL